MNIQLKTKKKKPKGLFDDKPKSLTKSISKSGPIPVRSEDWKQQLTEKRKQLSYGLTTINEPVHDDKEDPPIQVNELQAFQQDYSECPSAPDSKTYDKMPVSQFGEAMLRGMGWAGPEEDQKDSSASNPTSKRPALLGLGAKFEPGLQDANLHQQYIPLVKKRDTERKTN